MKKPTDIKNNNIGTKEERQIFMFFSKKSSNQFGHKTAYVIDNNNGEKKKVSFTATSVDEVASEYKWPDKELIWSGKSSDFQVIGTERPACHLDFPHIKH